MTAEAEPMLVRLLVALLSLVLSKVSHRKIVEGDIFEPMCLRFVKSFIFFVDEDVYAKQSALLRLTI